MHHLPKDEIIEIVKDVPPKKRAKIISEINEKNKIRVGEKLIYILDKWDDRLDAKYIA